MKFIVPIIVVILLTACVNRTNAIKVRSLDDVPNIAKLHSNEIGQLKIGMSKGQVLGLFPYAVRECNAANVCNITMFREDLIQLDSRLSDLDILTGGLVSLLALTCIFSTDDCTEAAVAALNLGVAAAIESNRIHTSSSQGDLISLVQWINIKTINDQVTQWTINQPLTHYQPKQYKNELPSLEEALGGNN